MVKASRNGWSAVKLRDHVMMKQPREEGTRMKDGEVAGRKEEQLARTPGEQALLTPREDCESQAVTKDAAMTGYGQARAWDPTGQDAEPATRRCPAHGGQGHDARRVPQPRRAAMRHLLDGEQMHLSGVAVSGLVIGDRAEGGSRIAEG